MNRRVDQIPPLWRPLWLAASWAVAIAWWALVRILAATCRVHADALPPDGPRIFALWHSGWPVWFAAYARSHRRHVWLQHPAAYMKPVHIGLELMGIRVLLGSGGDEGRRAAEDLSELLKDGWSTVVSPDGPAGPPRTLKKGVLHIARDSGVPIVPVRLEARPAARLPTWDRKIVPLPFAHVDVTFGEAIEVRAETFDEARDRLAAALGA